jgi:hypothetical protein
MKATISSFFRRVIGFCAGAAMMLALLILMVAATIANAQIQIFVPGTTNGCFGNPVDECIPLVAALTVRGPGSVTVTYVSGTVTDAGVNTGPDGVSWIDPRFQIPLQEKHGVWLKKMTHLDGLIGVFVPQSRVLRNGFNALDGTKQVTHVGITPDRLFFIGTGKTFRVKEAGTFFLGINDCWVSDNGGGFNVTVTGP